MSHSQAHSGIPSTVTWKGQVEIKMVSHVGVRAVPEPGTLGLLGLALLGLGYTQRKRLKA